jgi:hypothetical protein
MFQTQAMAGLRGATLGKSGKFPAGFLIQNGRISMRSGIMDRAGPRSGIRKRI